MYGLFEYNDIFFNNSSLCLVRFSLLLSLFFLISKYAFKSVKTLSDTIIILSFCPFPDLTVPNFSLISISLIFKFTHSETLKPEEYNNCINNLCLGFSTVFNIAFISSFVRTVGSFFSIFGDFMSTNIFFLYISSKRNFKDEIIRFTEAGFSFFSVIQYAIYSFMSVSFIVLISNSLLLFFS